MLVVLVVGCIASNLNCNRTGKHQSGSVQGIPPKTLDGALYALSVEIDKPNALDSLFTSPKPLCKKIVFQHAFMADGKLKLVAYGGDTTHREFNFVPYVIGLPDSGALVVCGRFDTAQTILGDVEIGKFDSNWAKLKDTVIHKKSNFILFIPRMYADSTNPKLYHVCYDIITSDNPPDYLKNLKIPIPKGAAPHTLMTANPCPPCKAGR